MTTLSKILDREVKVLCFHGLPCLKPDEARSVQMALDCKEQWAEGSHFVLLDGDEGQGLFAVKCHEWLRGSYTNSLDCWPGAAITYTVGAHWTEGRELIRGPTSGKRWGPVGRAPNKGEPRRYNSRNLSH